MRRFDALSEHTHLGRPDCRRTCKNAEITTGRRHCLMSVGTGPAQTGHGTLIVALDASGLICRGVRPTAGARWTGRHRMHKQLMGQILRHVRNPALSDDRRHFTAPRRLYRGPSLGGSARGDRRDLPCFGCPSLFDCRPVPTPGDRSPAPAQLLRRAHRPSRKPETLGISISHSQP